MQVCFWRFKTFAFFGVVFWQLLPRFNSQRISQKAGKKSMSERNYKSLLTKLVICEEDWRLLLAACSWRQ